MILTSSIIVTMRRNAALILDGAVVVRQGTIIAVDSSDKIFERYPGHRVLRMEHAVLMPGLVNLHTHLELPPLLETISASRFPDWILNLIKAKKAFAPKVYAAAATKNIRTLIRTGTTTAGEICTHDKSPALLLKSGLRAKIFSELISMSPDSPHPRINFPAARGLIQFGLSPHTPYTVSERVLRDMKKRIQTTPGSLAMHVAESRDEIRLLQGRKSGLADLYRLAGWDLSWAPGAGSSFEYLDRIGLLSSNLLAVHAVQVTDRDIALIRKSRASIAHCPRSNKETGVGRMPLKKFLDADIPVGLGTDSLASSPTLNMWDEMRFAYRVHRRDGITARAILSIATAGGATALGLGGKIGTLEKGKKADLIAVPLPDKNTGDLYSDLLRETKSSIMTMVNGKILYQGKRRETR